MEKANFINVIVSIMLILAGCGFLLFIFLQGSWNVENIVFLIIALVLILYGILRIYITNKSAHQI